MPKLLSLKKTHKDSTKHQMAITNFFKNCDTNGTKNPTASHKINDLPKTTLELKPEKRKALSPPNPVFDCEHVHHSNNTQIKKSPLKATKKYKLKNGHSYKHKDNDHESKYFAHNQRTSQTQNGNIEDHIENKADNDINKKSPLKCLNTDNGSMCIIPIKSPRKDNDTLKDIENLECYFNADLDLPLSGPGQQDVVISPKKYKKVSVVNNENEPQKSRELQISSSKSGTPVKNIEYGDNDVDDLFDLEWDTDKIMDEIQDDLDLTTLQRCEVVSVKYVGNAIELRLTCNKLSTTCIVEGNWLCLNIQEGDVISVLATRNISGQFKVNSTSGLIVFRPDYLLSSTSVVAGVFCQRKAVLQERWRGIDSANMAMTIGILIHELVQKTLTECIISIEIIRKEAFRIIKESTHMLYDAGIDEDTARTNMELYIVPLSEFINTYLSDKPSKKTTHNNWGGHIDKVLDIEENLCCPKLGLKGKIDATLQVTIHERQGKKREIVPLEIKSGRASGSVEHRGQLVLYGMMLSLLREEDPTMALQRGLLLYLKERVEVREVSCGYPERRDLVMLRNQLVQYLTSNGGRIDDDSDKYQRLPDPIHRESVCAKCPYLTVCSLHLWHTDGPKVSQSHPLSKLRNEALGHLSIQHIEYFLHWAHLLKLEEKVQLVTSPLHSLWTDSVEKRVKRGTCTGNLTLYSVQESGHRFMHIFHRNVNSLEDTLKGNKTNGPQEGDFSIVGIQNRPWIAAGTVVLSTKEEIKILLERNLSCRQSSDTMYHIDTYESYVTTVQNLTNLGVLIEDSERAERLRSIIIDKTKPSFVDKLPREMHRLGTKLMRTLNIEQQRAVFKALSAKDYVLLQGLPGTGKTQTVSVLIQMLVSLKQRVLVTAHTHSAVDTVLSRLSESIKIMRLGSSSRVAPKLLEICEERLASSCKSVEELSKLYESMEVVGVTCLGAAHAMLARTTFDVCVVDEATQVLQCTVLRPLFAAKRFVLVGDPEQLPPVVRSKTARQSGMEESLFHRLMGDDATCTLRLQYRMNQALADLANSIAYSDRLKCANPSVANARLNIDVEKFTKTIPWIVTACSHQPEYAAVFIDIESIASDALDGDRSKSISNWNEACVVLALVEAMKEGGVKNSDIGVIAPYRDQVSLLRRTLAHLQIEASTVDQFQGRDKSVIIYSCTKKDDGKRNKAAKEEEILNDQRRLAVSVTRSKHKLIVIGNSIALRRYEPIQRLIKACHKISIDINIFNELLEKYKELKTI